MNKASPPEISEIATTARDPMVWSFQTIMQPTDATLRLKGGLRGIGIYDEIRRDPHAFAILQKRVLEVVSREWKVLAASNSALDKQAADLVERQLKGLNFDRLTRGLLGAVLRGFAVAEVIWELRGGEWWASAAKVRKQRRFRFTVDGELRLVTETFRLEGEAVPDRKFIVHRHSIDDDDDDPYGVGLGSVLFWPAWFKRQVLGNWLRGTERFASPTVNISYEGAYDERRQEEMLEAARRLSVEGGIAHPSNVTVELLEAKGSGGGEISEKLARYLDELMSEATLGETLSTNSGQRGARSLGEVHNEVRIAIAKADADLVSETLKDTLIRWIVDLNLPGAGLPTVYRDFPEAENLNDKVKRDQAIFDMGFEPKDETYINETYGGEWVKKQPPAPGASIDKPALRLVPKAGPAAR